MRKIRLGQTVVTAAPMLAGLLFAAAVMVPIYGPLVDHHYAERLPFHAHLFASESHSHSYQHPHIHPLPESEGPSASTAVPGVDGLTTVPMAANGEMGAAPSGVREPQLAVDQLSLVYVMWVRQGESPPLRPPRHLA